jgi:hypothetical protein
MEARINIKSTTTHTPKKIVIWMIPFLEIQMQSLLLLKKTIRVDRRLITTRDFTS